MFIGKLARSEAQSRRRARLGEASHAQTGAVLNAACFHTLSAPRLLCLPCGIVTFIADIYTALLQPCHATHRQPLAPGHVRVG